MTAIDSLSGSIATQTTDSSSSTSSVDASQQSSFDAAMAAAQLGLSSTSGTSTDSTDPAAVLHLVLESSLQASLTQTMDDIDRNRKEASVDDDG